MLDKYLIPFTKQPLTSLAKQLSLRGVRADHVTLAGFVIGMLGVVAIAVEMYWLGLLGLLLNRLMDGIDGTLARIDGATDAGGFLDIVLDFIFYAAFVFGFAIASPEANAVAAAFLICSFMGTGSSFLAFAIMAEKHQIKRLDYGNKSLYFLGGITEGTETILCFVLLCLWPHHFTTIALVFACLCWVTTVTRLYAGYGTLKQYQER